jgi:hypothetical protein
VTEVARDSRGRFYTTSRRGEPVEVWDSLGKHVATVGRSGSGPGEFSGWPLSLFIDVGDTLHVLDGLGRWSVFDSAFNSVRTFTAARAFRTSTLIDGGPLVFTSSVSWGEPDAAFYRMTRDGRPDGSHGKSDVSSSFGSGRLSSTGPDHTIWIAPAPGTGKGFVLENRSINGELLNVVERDAPWLPLTGYSDEPNVPTFRTLHVDDDGLLWVALSVKDPRWQARKPGESPAAASRRKGELYDMRFEVLDPRTGSVLASVRYDDMSESELAPIYSVGRSSRLFWGSSSDSLGQKTLTVYSLQLARQRQ